MQMKTFYIIILFVAIFVSSIFFTFPIIQSQDLNPSPGKLAPGTGVWKVEHAKCSNGEVRTFVPPRCEGGPCTTRLPKEREPKGPVGPKPPPPAPQPPAALIPNPAWQVVAGYTQSFDQCSSLCNAYRSSGCSGQTAIDYCNALFSVDLNKNGNIDASQYGNTPIGGTTCDTNIHCYDVVQNCECPGGQTLNLGTCVQILYSSFTSQGLNFVQAYSTISANLHGNCGAPTPKT
jgi:hypothetical protein